MFRKRAGQVSFKNKTDRYRITNLKREKKAHRPLKRKLNNLENKDCEKKVAHPI
jgi:hypothetical protein